MREPISLAEQLKQNREAVEVARGGARSARVAIANAGAVARADARGAQQTRDMAQRDQSSVASFAAQEASAREDYEQLIGAQHVLLDLMAEEWNPTTKANKLSDDYPVLMFPLRVETRFMQGANGPQLCVRAFPDDLLVDGFEPTLTQTELESAKQFWSSFWSAGTLEAGERAAWRSLVASHGVGRAAWIVSQYRPLAGASPPVKASANGVILVVSAQPPPPPNTAPAIAAYWRAIWNARGDAELIARAAAELENAIGATQAAVAMAAIPDGLDPARGGLGAPDLGEVQVAFLPLPADPATRPAAWTEPARVRLLPERLVVVGFVAGAKVFEHVGKPIPWPLQVGPDPDTPPAGQAQGPEVDAGPELAWLFDFDESVARGLGFRIDLTAAQAASGFDRLLVAGLRLGATLDETRGLVEEWITHQYHSSRGFTFLAQGTPTNNTEGAKSGYQRGNDPDAAFDLVFRGASAFAPSGDLHERPDGQWFADLVGVDPAALQSVAGAKGKEAAEARAMNEALFPATLGYMLETMMAPIFDQSDIDGARRYFTDYVLGRGFLPVIRVGRQPYGILPTTAFSRIKWMEVPTGVALDPDVLAFNRIQRNIYTALRGIDADWRALVAGVSRVGGSGDPHQRLLDIVGLHPASVEFHQRTARSVNELINFFALWGGNTNTAWKAAQKAQLLSQAMATLTKAGYAGSETPDLLQKLFVGDAPLFSGPVIDDRPLSETDLVRAYTQDGRNYLAWLRDAAGASFDTLRTETGFLNGPPTALLYVLLRHALQLGYWDTSFRLHENAALLDAAQGATRTEHNFIGIQSNGPSGSRYEMLYGRQPSITNAANVTVVDHITQTLNAQSFAPPEYQLLQAQLAALETLKDLPTARLERLLAEHLDCCSYRVDAWWRSLVEHRLTALRYPGKERGASARKGVHLGAYSWLEAVRPKQQTRTPVTLPADLAAVFDRARAVRGERGKSQTSKAPSSTRPDFIAADNTAPLMRDSGNAGFIHAPSLNHAVTAAVLRNGHLANATSANPDLFAVNLSSERMRKAVAMLEGLREGQSMSSLLGYWLESGLHDRHAQLDLHEVIYILREAFPLAANKMTATQAPAGTPLEAVDPSNVVDGLSLLSQIRTSGVKTYPFGRALDTISSSQADAVNEEVDRLLDIYDALADLALAEGVYHVVGGNYDRAAANLDAFAKGGFPIEPEVVQTPRSGVNLDHRVALHFETSFDASVSPVTDVAALTPRAIAEPKLNRWLASILPAPSTVACKVRYQAPGSTAWSSQIVTQADLGMQPIDMLFCAVMGSTQAMAELDDRIAAYVLSTCTAKPDVGVDIRYSEAVPNYVSLFELSALLRHLRDLLLRSRALTPLDMVLPSEASRASGAAIITDASPLVSIKSGLTALAASVDTFAADMEARLGVLLASGPATLLARIDVFVADYVALLSQAGRYGVASANWGSILDWRGRIFADLRASVGARVADWRQKHDAYKARINDYNNLPAGTPKDWRIEELKRAERLISTSLTAAPASSSAYQADLLLKQSAFEAKLLILAQLEDTPRTTLSDYLADVKTAMNSIGAFDLKPFEIEDVERRVLAFEAELWNRANALSVEITAMAARVQAGIDAHGSAATAADRLLALDGAAKALFGDAFRIMPRFQQPAGVGAEMANAIAAAATLLNHAQTVADIPDPVDHWLHGVARVREKMTTWEAVTLFSEAFGQTGPALTPVQLPHVPDASWFALEFPATQKLDSGHLLYTAHFSAAFDADQECCGLLLDEWSEVVPGDEEVTGIAFHYDRPNAEAPQALLLMTPPDVRGHWLWEDVVDTLNETLDLAKKRTVEPGHIDTSPLSRFLPAVMLATTTNAMTISYKLRSLQEGG